MSTMYIFDESGLNALINHIKTTRNMADSNESAIGGLGEDLVGLTEAVQSELAGKQGTLTFDTTPTEGSSNPVTSDGVAQAIKANGGTPIVTATSADGKVYTATVEGMDSLEVGKEIIIIPDYTTTITNPTLNVNGLGAKYLRCTVAGNNATTTISSTNNWLYSGKPVKVRWNGSFWATDIIGSVDGNSISGIIEIENGGTGATTAEQALANLGGIAAGAVGNLHMWERGEVVSQEVERKIEISTTTKNITYQDDSITVYCGTGVKLSGDSLALDGTLATTTIGDFQNGSHYDKKYFYTSENPNIFYEFNSVQSASSNNRTYSVYEITINEKIVNIFEYDYLTSTDPNAYPKQSAEGGQDAHYVLGDVVTSEVYLGHGGASNVSIINVSDSISVSDDGTITQTNPQRVTIGYGGTINYETDELTTLIAGKFLTFVNKGNIPADMPMLDIGNLYYIPSSVTVTFKDPTNEGMEYHAIDKYQPVTGYPAIPANTVITYLGQLGEPGARIEVVSYVGTGTYGPDNPVTIKFNIIPKILFISCAQSDDDTNVASGNGGWVRTSSFSGTTAKPGLVTFDGKNVSLYAPSGNSSYDARSSYNYSGWEYTAIAIS